MFRKLVILLIIIPSWISALIVRRYNFKKRYSTLRKWCKLSLKILGYDLEVKNLDYILENENIYFVSNHQGTIDPAILISAIPTPFSFISKKENEKLPVFGSWAKTIYNIHFNRDSREDSIYMLRESGRRLKKGSLLIFPEGTRSKCGKLNDFKVGSIQPAFLAKAVIVPVSLSNAYDFDYKKSINNKIKVTFNKPIRYDEYKSYSQTEICSLLKKIIEKNVS